MASNAELASVYSALILVNDDVAVNGEKISTILKAAAVDVEPYWPDLFAKASKGVNMRDLITNIGSRVGAAPAVGGEPAAASAALAAELVKEGKKEEEPEEFDNDMGFGFFD